MALCDLDRIHKPSLTSEGYSNSSSIKPDSPLASLHHRIIANRQTIIAAVVAIDMHTLNVGMQTFNTRFAGMLIFYRNAFVFAHIPSYSKPSTLYNPRNLIH